MTSAGLVAYEDVPDARVDECVVGRKVRAAGIPEYDVNAFGLEALHDGVDGTHHRRFSSFVLQLADSNRSLSALESRRFWLHPDLGKVQIGSAAHAHRVVEHDQLAAAGALAAHLVALRAVRERDEQSQHRHDGADQEPDPERGSADPAHDASRDAKPQRDQQVDHSLRTAQSTA